MTGKALLDTAVTMLGYVYEDDLYRPALVYINQICTDLCLAGGYENKRINDLSEKINLPDGILNDVAVYGLAMWIALLRGDGEKNQFFASVYNQKRQRLTSINSRKDVLPNTEG